MKYRLVAIMLVLMFSVTTLSVLPVTMDTTTLAAHPALEVKNTLADGETYSMRIPILEDESVLDSNPGANYAASLVGGGLWVGRDDGGSGQARAWMKFDLSHVPKEIAIIRAVWKGYLNSEYNTSGADEPVGVYYSEDDSWTATTITWNNQPVFSVSPVDVIDSPAEPAMFVPDEWYEWDVTSSVIASLNDDKVLSLVMKEVEETVTYDTWKYFNEEESTVGPASQLEIEYVVPGLNTLAVDGHTSSPLIDYIQSDAPDFSWNPVLQSGDFQRDFQLEVWNNSLYNDSMFMQEKHSAVGTFFSGAVSGNNRPFGIDDEMKFQFKYIKSLVPKTGIIDKLFFEISEDSGTIVLENLSIFLLGVDSVTDLTSDFVANYEGREPIQVLYRRSYSATATDNWLEIDIENTFMLSKSTSLIVELRFSDNTGDLLYALQTTGQGGSVAYTVGDMESTTAVILADRTHGLRVEIATDTILDSTGVYNSFPFGADSGYDGRYQVKYNQSMIDHEGLIDKLYFSTRVFGAETTYENLSIYIVETPVDGKLNATHMDENYGGLSPTLVLYAESYTVQNLGYTLVIDVNNIFYYTNTNDLLIELRWDDKDSTAITTARVIGVGGYRAYDLRHGSTNYLGESDLANALYIDFIYDTTSFQYCSCFPLVNGTEYYLRVKISDST
ncbi:MAG: DNRLRE domain-containing protein, partial [Candidatus Thorarchaeota archaeon]